MKDPNMNRVTGFAGPPCAPNRASRFTFHVSRSPFRPFRTPHSAFRTPHSAFRTGFTLLELLVVISIIILIAAIAGPVVGNFKPNVTASATRQLLDDVARARQLAISQHTTVYMIFCPTNFWFDAAYNPLDSTNKLVGTNLFDKQLTGYTFISLRTIGDQPGRNTVRYLAPWRTLPEGVFITPDKFALLNSQYFYIATNGNPFAYQIFGFNRSSDVAANMNSPKIPFPTAEAELFNASKEPYIRVPFIAFDYLGRLMYDTITPESKDALIPIAKGSVGVARDPVTKVALASPPSFTEAPPGNSTNAYNIIVINHFTGRAHLEHAEVQ